MGCGAQFMEVGVRKRNFMKELKSMYEVTFKQDTISVLA